MSEEKRGEKGRGMLVNPESAGRLQALKAKEKLVLQLKPEGNQEVEVSLPQMVSGGFFCCFFSSTVRKHTLLPEKIMT